MSERVVILGGLGYIGSALLELYRQERGTGLSVLVVDKRFDPARVEALPPCATYVQGDIRDAELMRRLLAGANVCHLLAAEVEAETSVDRAAAINEVNFVAAQQVVSVAPATCRVMFPSSANVFGGNQDGGDPIYDDDAPPQPVYPYAESKAAMEEFLRDRGGNYVCLRFGTNYGWAPGIRFNLVANLFVKLALQGKTLTVHGAGLNYRPFCHTFDCARALRFLSRAERVDGQMYHVVAENWRIVALAELVATLVPGTAVKCEGEPGPFGSYRMTSNKLLRAGFTFRWDMPRGLSQVRERLAAVRGLG